MDKAFLFLLGNLPPLVSANGVCVNSVMNEIRKHYKCFSISFSENPSDHDDYNYHIPMRKWDRIIQLLEQTKRRNQKIRHFFLRVYAVFIQMLMLPFWPAFSLSTVVNFYKKSSLLIKRENISCVVAVSYPGETLLALVLLRIRFRKRISLIMYPLDVSLGGKFDGKKIEKKISVISSKWLYRFCVFFADKIIVLENTIDLYKKILTGPNWAKAEICGIPLIKQELPQKTSSCEKKIKLVYGGNIDSRVRNPFPILDYLEQLAKKNSCEICVDIYGFVSSHLSLKMSSRYSHIEINNCGWVPEKELDLAVENASALLSIGNNVGFLIPSKIFKYMSSNKPIIHFCAIKDDPCVPYLTKYGHSFLLYGEKMGDVDFVGWLQKNQSFSVDCQKLFPQCTPNYTACKIMGC